MFREPYDSRFSHTDCSKVANKKQRDNAAQDAEMKKRKEESEAKNEEDETAEDSSAPADLLAAEGEEDVIF